MCVCRYVFLSLSLLSKPVDLQCAKKKWNSFSSKCCECLFWQDVYVHQLCLAGGAMTPFCWVSPPASVLLCRGEEGSVTSCRKLCFKGVATVCSEMLNVIGVCWHICFGKVSGEVLCLWILLDFINPGWGYWGKSDADVLLSWRTESVWTSAELVLTQLCHCVCEL